MIDVQQIEVWMHGRQVGRLALTPQRPQTCAFEYTAEWLQEGFSISPFELPLTPGLKIAPYKPFDGHFGVFSDSLPDGWGQLILHRHLAQQGINSLSLNPLQQLCLVGSNGRGALEYRPDESIQNTQEYLDLAQIAAESFAILEDDNYAGKHIAELVQRGGSPGGARPKIFLKQGDDEWLIKFRAKNDKKSVGREEYRYSLLAKQCGIEMPETKLFEDQWFGVKRFDRVNGRRLHVVSASGLLQADYQIPSIDYLHLFSISARLSHSMEELWKIFRLMCFNVLIGNRDDHAKNFSFIYDKGWRFAPAYDLLPCGTTGDYHTTSVNDNPLPERADILRLAERVGLDNKQATTIFDKMKKILPILCFLLLSISSLCTAQPTASVSGTLPVIYIQTTDDAAIDSKEVYVSGTLSIDPLNTGMPALNEVAAQFKGRGNWTWSGFDKKPYKIKFDAKQSVLGMPKNKHWCLLAHADDDLGYLKNTVGFMLSEQIDLRWTPRFQPVELVINGSYEGLYFLTEHVRIGSNRVNITEQADNATDSVSGGWLVEIDNYSSEGNITFHEGNGQYVMVSLKEPEVLSAQQRDYIEQQIYILNDAIYGSSATKLWGMMDVEEAAKYYLVQEIMEDCESYHGSCYLYKDRDRNGIVDKWKFGPVWDFGNAYDRQQERWIYDRPIWPQYWIGQLAQWPEFQTKVSENWYTYYHSYLSATRSRIADFVTTIEQAARNDAERWRGTQGYCDNSNMKDRKNEFLNRFNSRIDWLFSQWGEGTQPPTQAIDPVTCNPSPVTHKIIKDNQVLINRNGILYTLTGQEVK